MKKVFVLVMLGIVLLSMVPVVLSASVRQAMIEMSFVNQNPSPAKAGDVVEVRVLVDNTGGTDAKNVLVAVNPDYPFSLLDDKDEQQVIEALPGWPSEASSKTLVFRLRVDKEAGEGDYPVEMKYSLDGGSSWAVRKFTVSLSAQQVAQVIFIDKTKLLPGKETNLTFTITNLGNAALKNVIFSWNEPNGYVLPVGSDNTRYISYLGPGASMPLLYTVIASVTAKQDLYSLNLNLNYDISNSSSTGSQSLVTKAGVFIGGETDFDVTFSESSAGKTSLSVSNVGSNPAYSVTVRVPNQQSYRITGSADSIIGNLDKGDYTIVSFQIASNANMTRPTGTQQPTTGAQNAGYQTGRQMNATRSAGNNMLTVVIDYTDTTGARQSLTKQVPIQFQSGSTAGTFAGRTAATATTSWTSYLWWVAGIAVIAGLYWKRKEIAVFILKK